MFAIIFDTLQRFLWLSSLLWLCSSINQCFAKCIAKRNPCGLLLLGHFRCSVVYARRHFDVQLITLRMIFLVAMLSGLLVGMLIGTLHTRNARRYRQWRLGRKMQLIAARNEMKGYRHKRKRSMLSRWQKFLLRQRLSLTMAPSGPMCFLPPYPELAAPVGRCGYQRGRSRSAIRTIRCACPS